VRLDSAHDGIVSQIARTAVVARELIKFMTSPEAAPLCVSPMEPPER